MSISIPALAPSSFIHGQSTQVWNTQQSTLKRPHQKALSDADMLALGHMDRPAWGSLRSCDLGYAGFVL
jgi:hypothetical protein